LFRGYDALGLPEDGKWPSIMSLSIGVTYLVVGLLQLGVGLGLLPPVLGFGDILGGVLLMVVAAVFLTGVNPLRKNEQEGYAYIAVGYILAAVLFGLQVLVMATNALGWLLRYEDWLSWNIVNDLTPSFWLFIGLVIVTLSLILTGNVKKRIGTSGETSK
jgi:hypothetical protein